MVRDAEQTARTAEASTSNGPGYCLQWSREQAAIAAKYGDASTAWAHADHRHPGDRHPPRGAMVYWTGGSSGYGHIAVSLGDGRIRSSDAGGAGRPATVELAWVEEHWGLPYAGWADNVNDVVIPDVGTDKEDDMPYTDWPKKDREALASDVADQVWQRLLMGMDDAPEGRHAGTTLSQTHEMVRRLVKDTGA